MPTQNNEQLKKQRERFLSFAFASSDLLLEINELGVISYALGTVKKFAGKDSAKDLEGKEWLKLFIPKDRMTLKHMVTTAKPGLRAGPSLAKLEILEKNDANDPINNVIVSAIKMPNKTQTYIVVAASNALMDQLGATERQQQEKKVLDKEGFIDAAQETLRMASDLGQDVDLTMIQLLGAEKAQNRFGKEGWSQFSEDIDNLLRDLSIDGNSAAGLGSGRYSLLHTPEVNINELTGKISDISKKHDPFGEGLDIKKKSISANMGDMNEKDITRALFYTLNEFERKGANMSVETLNSSFKIFVAANTQKINEFRKIIQDLDFSMHFQPIVQLNNRECSHYEMLCRFKEGNTFEWIMFGEGIGMAAEFDFAVCRRALNFIDTKRYNTKENYSINISGQSISNNAFLIKLNKAIDLHAHIKHRIILEITESTQIKDLDAVGKVIGEFQKKGIKIALDDFGAGAASFQYLSSMPVDYVKIDGKYIRNILEDTRDRIMVKNLVQMCKDLGIMVVGEFVENEDIADLLIELGVDYAQGYYFGKPLPSPDYVKPPRKNT
jgi:EAL domain-containing protein (putative c-di-GMP-specific phosphodiesterase class I)